MPDRVLFALMGLAALAMIALALVWPQGLGARSPAPFGHAVVHEAPQPSGAEAAPPPVLGFAPPPPPASSASPTPSP
ncbi:MAG: hypothetical protein WDM92_04970 [Caulobacteraceae bacterium]